MGSQKIHFTLSDEALAIIARRAPSPHKRGAWISKAVIDYDHILAGVASEDGADGGLLEEVVNRLARIEKQMVALLAKEI
jgi:aspartyl aminopeptidase